MTKKKSIRERIRSAYLELRRMRSIRQIRIKEIVEAAGCSRRSFYNEFSDIYDLEGQIYDEFFRRFGDVIRSTDNSFNETFIDFLFDNIDFLLAYYGSGDVEAINDLSVRYLEALKENHDPMYDHFHYDRLLQYLTYCLSGFLATLNYWASKNDVNDKEQFARFVKELQEDIVRNWGSLDPEATAGR